MRRRCLDRRRGGRGADELSGGVGNERLMGGVGRDRVHGEDGTDDMRGGAGDDSLKAGAGNDMLNGDAGRDQLVGGDGLDREVDPQDRFADGDDDDGGDGDGFDNDHETLDILHESPGSVSAYADDTAAAPIIASVSADVRGLLQIPADDAALRVRVSRDRFGALVTGTWRYLTPDRIQVWGRWAYPESDRSKLNAFAQYSYTGPSSGNIADSTNPANYVMSEERRVYANSAVGPLTFVSWLLGRPANFCFTALNPQTGESQRGGARIDAPLHQHRRLLLRRLFDVARAPGRQARRQSAAHREPVEPGLVRPAGSPPRLRGLTDRLGAIARPDELLSSTCLRVRRRQQCGGPPTQPNLPRRSPAVVSPRSRRLRRHCPDVG